MLLDFFKMVIHPDHYRSTWRDGDFIVEFVPADDAIAATLLRALLERSREAGCNRIRTYNLHHWRYWPLLRRAGFVPRESDTFIGASCEDRLDEVTREENWQIMPSDSDVT